jgi:hypothetical protein
VTSRRTHAEEYRSYRLPHTAKFGRFWLPQLPSQLMWRHHSRLLAEDPDRQMPCLATTRAFEAVHEEIGIRCLCRLSDTVSVLSVWRSAVVPTTQTVERIAQKHLSRMRNTAQRSMKSRVSRNSSAAASTAGRCAIWHACGNRAKSRTSRSSKGIGAHAVCRTWPGTSRRPLSTNWDPSRSFPFTDNRGSLRSSASTISDC